MRGKPEKLFDRVAWSYMPANLQGCLVLALFIVSLFAFVGGGILLSRALNSSFPEVLAVLGAVVAFVAFDRFSKRHS